MILHWLKLENIRSYINEQIEFPEGSVLLSGDIGSGKTTILLSIEFALFGFNKNDISGNTLLRHGKHEGSVELYFEIEQKKVIIKRYLRRSNAVKQEHGYIIINDQKIDCTAVELKSKVLDLLGYPQSLVSKSKDYLYRYTVYTPQDAMKQILLEDKENRLETLRKLFNIDKYKKTRENTSIIIRELKTKKMLYEQQTADIIEKQKLLEQMIERKSRIITDIIAKKKSLSEITKNIAENKQKIQEIEIAINNQKHLQTEIKVSNEKKINFENNLKKNELEISSSQLQIQNAKQKIAELIVEKPSQFEEKQLLEELEGFQKRLAFLQQEIISCEQKKNFAEKRKITLAVEIKQMLTSVEKSEEKKQRKKQLDESVQQKQELQEEITIRESLLQKNIIQLSEMEAIIKMHLSTQQKITFLNECPTCLQQVNEDYKQRTINQEQLKCAELSSKIKIIAEQKAKNELAVKTLKEKFQQIILHEKELAAIEQQIKADDEKKLQITAKQNQLEEIEAELKNANELMQKLILDGNSNEKNKENKSQLEQKISEIKIIIDSMRKYNETLQQSLIIKNSIQEKEIAILKLHDENRRLISEIGQINDYLQQKSLAMLDISKLEFQYSKEKNSFEELLNEEKKIMVENTRLNSENLYLEKNIDELNKDLELKISINSKIANINELIHWLSDKFTPLAALLERQILLSIYRQFNECFITWFSILIDDENITVRLDEEFTPYIQQNGYDTDFENLSGGEKTAVALAYRLALNKVINDYVTTISTKDLLILDEPTEGFSYDQLDKMKDVLDQINVKQIIIVSHEAKVESFVQNVIRLNKTGHISKIVS